MSTSAEARPHRLQVGRGRLWLTDRVYVFPRSGTKVWLSVFDSLPGLLLVFLAVELVIRATPLTGAPVYVQALVGGVGCACISAGGASVLGLVTAASGHAFFRTDVAERFGDAARYVVDHLDDLRPDEAHWVAVALLEISEPVPGHGRVIFADVANQVWSSGRGRR